MTARFSLRSLLIVATFVCLISIAVTWVFFRGTTGDPPSDALDRQRARASVTSSSENSTRNALEAQLRELIDALHALHADVTAVLDRGKIPSRTQSVGAQDDDSPISAHDVHEPSAARWAALRSESEMRLVTDLVARHRKLLLEQLAHYESRLARANPASRETSHDEQEGFTGPDVNAIEEVISRTRQMLEALDNVRSLDDVVRWVQANGRPNNPE